ncbi:uncharacterized protein LOC143556434 [Bidens hawaiensis]|uniref:uncharacterized protein LOC143556434 n=1 Tax=Bidens hawaiensis TaxID=980011 RepID=UPI004049A64A
MSSDSSLTPDFQPDIDDISNSDLEDEAIFSVVLEAAQLVVQHCESSQPLKRWPHLQRYRVGVHDRLMKDYFSPDATFDSERFRRCFRMSRQLFLRIVGDLECVYAFFQQWADTRAYGTASDAMEEYLQMSETMAREALHTFYECIPQLYHKKYLRKPTQSDVQKIYEVHQQRHGFPEMLGSLDFMHWEWETCPVSWQGQYHQGDHDGPTVILEAAASFDLWIWHAFFGMPGANNDVAVINASSIFDRLTDGVSPDTLFSTNDVNYEY